MAGGLSGAVPGAMAKQDEEDASEDDDEEVDEAEVERQRLIAIKRTTSAKRQSVTGEKTQSKVGWMPPFHPKSPAQGEQIREALMRSFMFNTLPDSNLQQVVDAFAGPLVLKPGQEVISQGSLVESGEPGLFIIERGRLDVYRKAKDTEPHPGTKLTTYDRMGQSFGELALLYNCPRAATVVAVSEAVVWSIDRDTFNNCVKEGYRVMRERHEKFIASVELLKPLTEAERQKIVDVIQLRKYQRGDMVIKAGDSGNEFFMVEQGRAHAIKDGQTVKEYGPSDYFGELALLNRQARAADVVVQASPTVLAVLDADSFGRLLGSLTIMVESRVMEYGAATTVIPSTVVTASPSTFAAGSSAVNPVRAPSPSEGSLFGKLLQSWCVCSSMQVDKSDRTVV